VVEETIENSVEEMEMTTEDLVEEMMIGEMTEEEMTKEIKVLFC